MEQGIIDLQDLKSHKDVRLMENVLDAPVQQHSISSHSCRSENTLHSCSDRENSENGIPKDSLGPELSKQTAKGHINAQATESSDGSINWNTSCTFARPRIFCLQHALEIEELLEGKGGAHALIICHSGRLEKLLLSLYSV